MPQLPFVVAPKRKTRIVEAEVNGEICSLEFPVFGCILAGEAVAIRDHEYQAAVYRESSRLADALVDGGTEEVEAQRLAIRILSTRMGVPVPLDAAEQRLMLHHADLIANLQTTLTNEYKAQVKRTVTAAIVNRLPGCKDWSDDDTAGLPEPLQEAIAAFIDSERASKAPDRSPEEQIEEMVETLGKLAPPASPEPAEPVIESEPETPSQTPASSSPSPSTGPLPTGSAAASGPVPQSSAASASPVSPSPTSSKPSTKANAG